MATTLLTAVGLHTWLAILPFAQPSVLFSESFDDPRLLQRAWYDGSSFTLSDTQAYAGKGAIEYRWQADTTKPASSSGVRRLFEPADTVYRAGCQPPHRLRRALERQAASGGPGHSEQGHAARRTSRSRWS